MLRGQFSGAVLRAAFSTSLPPSWFMGCLERARCGFCRGLPPVYWVLDLLMADLRLPLSDCFFTSLSRCPRPLYLCSRVVGSSSSCNIRLFRECSTGSWSIFSCRELSGSPQHDMERFLGR